MHTQTFFTIAPEELWRITDEEHLDCVQRPCMIKLPLTLLDQRSFCENLSVRWVYLVTPLCLPLGGVCMHLTTAPVGEGGISTKPGNDSSYHGWALRWYTPGGAEGERSREEKRSTLSISGSTATSFWGLSTNSRSRCCTPDPIPVSLGSESELLRPLETVTLGQTSYILTLRWGKKLTITTSMSYPIFLVLFYTLCNVFLFYSFIYSYNKYPLHLDVFDRHQNK